MGRTVALLLLPVLSACAHPSARIPLRAPDPTGCYAIVYEEPNFLGAGDVLNGPGRYPRLTAIAQTNYGNWQNRIRSLRIGSTATVTVYADDAFAGARRRFATGVDVPRIGDDLSGRIQSLDLACSG